MAGSGFANDFLSIYLYLVKVKTTVVSNNIVCSVQNLCITVTLHLSKCAIILMYEDLQILPNNTRVIKGTLPNITSMYETAIK